MANVLYEAATVFDIVDPEKVEEILGLPKQINEATQRTDEENFDCLSNKQIGSLATAITMKNMIVLAEDYLNISDEIIEALQYENRWDVESFNRDILRHWANKNTASDQVMVCNFPSLDFRLLLFKKK